MSTTIAKLAEANMLRARLIVVNSSGGKDSQALLHVIATEAARLGILGRVVVAHATFPEEWKGTEAIARAQAAHYGVRFEVVQREIDGGSLLGHVRTKGQWPARNARYCTSDMKAAQVDKLITRLAPVGYVLNCLGTRSAESTERSKKAPLKIRSKGTNQSRTVMDWLPIFDFTLAEVRDTIREAGTPIHPAYAAGMPRLSCVFCVFAPADALLLAGRMNRELLDDYVAVERATGHRFTDKLSIAEIAARLDNGEEPVLPIRTHEEGGATWNS